MREVIGDEAVQGSGVQGEGGDVFVNGAQVPPEEMLTGQQGAAVGNGQPEAGGQPNGRGKGLDQHTQRAIAAKQTAERTLQEE